MNHFLNSAIMVGDILLTTKIEQDGSQRSGSQKRPTGKDPAQYIITGYS